MRSICCYSQSFCSTLHQAQTWCKRSSQLYLQLIRPCIVLTFCSVLQMIYVTGTTKRPVPLEHSLYYFGEFFPIARERIIPEVSNPSDAYLWWSKHSGQHTTRAVDLATASKAAALNSPLCCTLHRCARKLGPTSCTSCRQGFKKANAAFKKRNAPPETRKEEKRLLPTGRGGPPAGTPPGNQRGGRAPR